MTTCVSRLAPSPTGALHLGNARTFLVNWAIARKGGWRLLMRIEDLDGPRVKAETVSTMLQMLQWLGLDFDDAPTSQSHDLKPYYTAMRVLAQQGLVYSCSLTRRQIEQAASAPHDDEHELRYPPHLRPDRDEVQRYTFDAVDTNYRLTVTDQTLTVDDAIAGISTHRPADEVGDFVVWTKRGTPSYQLAVVVDDIRQGVTDVVRGDDLLASAARQMLLYGALGSQPPRWWHLPLVLGPDGRRLAKRHGDTRLESYRAAGVAPERIVGLLSYWCGMTTRREPTTADAFRCTFQIERLAPGIVTFTPDDHAWLLDGS
jgi:glutamyl-tRNA synthetase